ncbi:MAG: NIPSNAP family protein [Pseudomonadota bacterium]|nr:NIPSNAP family protein [Pseudomonadota bacterium]
MIIEMRSYDLRPGTVPAFEERFGAGLPARAKLSPLAAFWHTEVGPLNRVIHVWPYESLEARTRIRAEAIASGVWPPKVGEFCVAQQSEVFLPAPFSPPLEPRKLGGIYEIRLYTVAPGAIPGVIERWGEKIGERVKLSPLVGAWYSEFGTLNRWVHVWAYKDAGERQRIRAEAVSRGIWPPGSAAAGALIKQETMLVVPASFSPLG